MKNTINKIIANFLIAIILMAGITNTGYAQSSEVDTNNIDVSENSSNKESDFYRVEANSFVVHKKYFEEGEYVRIVMNGDSSTNLDIYVYDTSGNLIDSREGKTDYAVITLDIYRSETFQIKIVNRGADYNDYNLRIGRY